MKNQTKIELSNYLKTHTLSSEHGFNLTEIYRLFTKYEVSSFEDLMASPDVFYDYLMKNLDHLKCSFMDFFALPFAIVKFKDLLMEVLSEATYDRNRLFSETVTEILPNGDNTKILDVGAGAIPLSSIFIAENINAPVSAVDPMIFIDRQALERFNVNGSNEQFDLNFNLQPYDIVVGNKPCEAIPNMIASCGSKNVPYFINLCACNFSDNDKDGNRIIRPNWKNELRELDSKIKFWRDEDTAEEYAFNLDATPSQIGKIVEANKSVQGQTKKLCNLIDELMIEVLADIFSQKD